MALKAYKEQTFKAEVKFEDGSVKDVTFRLPKNTDVHTSDDGNLNVNTLFTFGNMAKPFDTPVQVEIEGGSILNIKTLRELIDLGVVLELSDVVKKWMEARDKAQAEKDRLIKKSQSAGDSSKKVTPPAND